MGTLERTRALALCLVAGGSASIGIFHVEGQALRERPQIATVSAPIAIPARAPTPVVPTVVVPEGVAATTPTSTPTPIEVANVRVPNLIGLRLTYAANRVERRGLRIVARDEEGNVVDLAYSQFYRVVQQDVPRGTTVVSGHVLEVRVRDRTASYSDWG